MGNILTTLRRLPTRTTALGAIIATAIIVPAALLAWGPDRPTFTIENPSDHITFNSITNNPNIGGDERNFVGIREKGTNGTWKDDVTVERNKEYVVRAYVHNNARADLNLVAQNVRATFNLPTTTAKKIQVQGTISADNSTPRSVWDEANFNSTEDFNLSYVAGSVKFSNNVFGSAGVSLPESIFTSAGAQLGYDKLDGKIPGCFQYDGYVYFTVKPQFAPKNSFETQKQVRKSGQTEWKKDITVNPGDTVDYMLTYKNTGEKVQDNVLLQDTLPTGMTYIDGSTSLYNGNNPNGVKISDNVTKPSGVNIGSYNPGAVAYVKFSAKAANSEQLPVCGPNKLTNKVRTTVDGGYKEDTADVTVPKECQPEAKYVCDNLAVEKIERTQFKFTTTTTAENATFKNVTYVIRNESGIEVERKTSTEKTLVYSQATAGKYTVQAYVTFTVNGVDKTEITSENCKKPFEVVPTPPVEIEVCDLETKKIITIKESDFDSSKHSKNLNDCKETPPVKIEVCDLTTKKVITINESDFDSSKHSKNLADCKETPPVKIDVCEISTKKVITINEKDFDSSKHSKNLNDCKETPPVEKCPIPGKEHLPKDSKDCATDKCPIPGKEHVPKDSADCNETPVELPQTGISGGATIAGIGLVTAGLGYALSSRRIRDMLIGQ